MSSASGSLCVVVAALLCNHVPALTAPGLPLTTSIDRTQVIRDLLTPTTYVIVVEHDLAVLDYLSDFICCLYGKPGKAR